MDTPKPTLVYKPLAARVEETDIPFYGSVPQLLRASIPHGWLVVSGDYHAVAFVPDEAHIWDGGSST